MAYRLLDLQHTVLTRLGDLDQQIWTAEEIYFYLRDAYREVATTARACWDTTYVENLPAGFSCTQPWEVQYETFSYGVANYTAEFERRLLTETARIGPANHTSPFEATDGLLWDIGASTVIPATVDLPSTVSELDRGVADGRGVDAIDPSWLASLDGRYEITQGSVYGYLWRKDGVRTLRKVRVPAAQADTVEVDGSWGSLRDPWDLSVTVTGSWGVGRRIPDHHPIGSSRFGLPRRLYLETNNMRLEHWREGRALDALTDEMELPDRVAVALTDQAQAKALNRQGPGQDLKLAAHYAQRWQRQLARLKVRAVTVTRERVLVFGGGRERRGMAPPRPRLPWSYGAVVR